MVTPIQSGPEKPGLSVTQYTSECCASLPTEVGLSVLCTSLYRWLVFRSSFQLSLSGSGALSSGACPLSQTQKTKYLEPKFAARNGLTPVQKQEKMHAVQAAEVILDGKKMRRPRLELGPEAIPE